MFRYFTQESRTRAPRFPSVNRGLKRLEITHRLNDAVPSALRPAVRRILFRRRSTLRVDAEDRQYLVDDDRDEVMKLAALLDRDLSAWLA